MIRDAAKLQSTARDLSELGLSLSNQSTPPTAETCEAIGLALVALSGALQDIAEALTAPQLTSA
ncbi:MAG: hypothetical protein D3X82_02810 [Candidatus Leucobacter sulfamidivorax]|nr:hypothetical protein [Candidatus Leucobacter sulfamidivorax]